MSSNFGEEAGLSGFHCGEQNVIGHRGESKKVSVSLSYLTFLEVINIMLLDFSVTFSRNSHPPSVSDCSFHVLVDYIVLLNDKDVSPSSLSFSISFLETK